MGNSDVYYEEYSEKSIVVRGNTIKFKEDLKKIGGMYNSGLQGGVGWIFKKEYIPQVKKLIDEIEKGKQPSQPVNNKHSQVGRYASDTIKSDIMSMRQDISDLKQDFYEIRQCIVSMSRDISGLVTLIQGGRVGVDNKVSVKGVNVKKNTSEVEGEGEDEDQPRLKRLLGKNDNSNFTKVEGEDQPKLKRLLTKSTVPSIIKIITKSNNSKTVEYDDEDQPKLKRLLR